MNIENIAFTTEFNLCSGCGICVGICPKQCIQWEKNDNGMYQPCVNSNACIRCGLCKEVCPGLGHQYGGKLDWEAVQGEVLQAYNAWSRSPEIRHVSCMTLQKRVITGGSEKSVRLTWKQRSRHKHL